jgi:alanine racemase
MNARQVAAFSNLSIPARRRSLANSAGVCLGSDYAFDLTRPGLALYGGVPRREAAPHIVQVMHLEAQVLQRRHVSAGDSVGYGADFVADRALDVAILNIGYADGYRRGFSGCGTAGHGRFAVLGRVSMDLIAVDVSTEPSLCEGDWVSIDYNLREAANRTGLSQYELLTGLGSRFERVWT